MDCPGTTSYKLHGVLAALSAVSTTGSQCQAVHANGRSWRTNAKAFSFVFQRLERLSSLLLWYHCLCVIKINLYMIKKLLWYHCLCVIPGHRCINGLNDFRVPPQRRQVEMTVKYVNRAGVRRFHGGRDMKKSQSYPKQILGWNCLFFFKKFTKACQLLLL